MSLESLENGDETAGTIIVDKTQKKSLGASGRAGAVKYQLPHLQPHT